MAYHSFMDMKEAVVATFREYLLPELEGLKSGQMRITSDIAAVNKRLDDVNQHMADQSRRIDDTNQRIEAVREELSRSIESVREELSRGIESVREELSHRMDKMNDRIDETNKRIDETNSRIDAVRDDTIHRFDTLNSRIDETNVNIAHLYEVIVRRDEYSAVVIKLNDLSNEVQEIKHRLAA